MDNYIVLTKRYAIYTVILITFFILLAFLTSHQSIFFGLTLGSIISLSNLLSTYFQVKRLGESVVSGRAKFSLGTLFRFALASFAVYTALQYPGLFHIYSVVIGLMLTYIIIYFNALLQLKHL